MNNQDFLFENLLFSNERFLPMKKNRANCPNLAHILFYQIKGVNPTCIFLNSASPKNKMTVQLNYILTDYCVIRA